MVIMFLSPSTFLIVAVAPLTSPVIVVSTTGVADHSTKNKVMVEVWYTF